MAVSPIFRNPPDIHARYDLEIRFAAPSQAEAYYRFGKAVFNAGMSRQERLNWGEVWLQKLGFGA